MNAIHPASEIIVSMLSEDCTGLFEHYGCQAEYQDNIEAPRGFNVLGTIDAGCSQLELTLLLNIPFEILALSYPCQNTVLSIPEEQLEDWLLEISNQLMGKIKARLIDQDLTLTLGLPVAHFDVDVTDDSTSFEDYLGLSFSIDGEIMECWIQVDIKDSDFCLSPHTDVTPICTGEIELF